MLGLTGELPDHAGNTFTLIGLVVLTVVDRHSYKVPPIKTDAVVYHVRRNNTNHICLPTHATGQTCSDRTAARVPEPGGLRRQPILLAVPERSVRMCSGPGVSPPFFVTPDAAISRRWLPSPPRSHVTHHAIGCYDDGNGIGMRTMRGNPPPPHGLCWSVHMPGRVATICAAAMCAALSLTHYPLRPDLDLVSLATGCVCRDPVNLPARAQAADHANHKCHLHDEPGAQLLPGLP